MKNKIQSLLCVLCVLCASVAVLTGCATKPADATQTVRVQHLAYAAASIGTQVALLENPAYRPAFELAYSNLDGLVNAGSINGVGLRNILTPLPIQELKAPEAQIAISSATVLFDSLTGNSVSLTNNVYVAAAATGIRDGLKVALGH